MCPLLSFCPFGPIDKHRPPVLALSRQNGQIILPKVCLCLPALSLFANNVSLRPQPQKIPAEIRRWARGRAAEWLP